MFGSLRKSCVAPMVLLAVGVTGTASAGILNISGDSNTSAEMTGSNFTGTLDYTFGGGSNGTLVISLTNTTPAPVGGFLTAFLFNSSSSDGTISVALTNSTDADFLDAAGSNGQPFGNPFLAGAGLSGTFEGGGAPQPGIAIGATGTFTFDVTATDAAALTEFSFLEGPFAFDFLVRFRGLTDGGSDKVPVPTPGALALLGVAGLTTTRRRR